MLKGNKYYKKEWKKSKEVKVINAAFTQQSEKKERKNQSCYPIVTYLLP